VINEEEADLLDEEDGDDIDYMSKNWLRNILEVIGDGDEREGPVETDHYNKFYGPKPGIGNLFQTILQCVLRTTLLNRDFFKRLVA